MKHFYKKQIQLLLSGTSLLGFSKDGLIVFINSLCLFSKKRVLFVSEKESFNRGFYRQSLFFKSGFLYYPEPPSGEVVPGFQESHDLIRAQAVIGVAKKGGGVCLGTKKAVSLSIINKKFGLKSLSVVVGKKADRDMLSKKLSLFGFKHVGCVNNQKELSVRGDVLDVFPENKSCPIRLNFGFGVLESLSEFDLHTQRTTKNLRSFVFYDLVGGPVASGKSFLDFVSWDIIINIERSGGCFSLLVGEGEGNKTFVFKNINDNLVNKKDFKKFLKRPKRGPHYVFYTNKKRKAKIKKLGGVPVPGLIKKPFTSNMATGFFVPDFKTQKHTPSSLSPKPNKNKHLETADVGDFVVHVLHGVGEFCGLFVRGPSGFEKEYIKIKYREGGVLFVPVDKSSLVHKYRGFGRVPKINKLGGRSWRASVLKTKKDIEVVSDSLISIYESRSKPRGFTYEKGGDIDVAIKKSFPYNETKDQKNAILDVLSDLSKKHPMDRLICGDVGFGKTEVALRAIVRVAASTKQVLFLCPTTVLSDQHYITAKERLGPLGIRVALLSRFQSKKNQQTTLFGLLSGSVDIVLGTHRLLSEDVVVPRLGLLIVDEEHRFGVKQKEKIRALKRGVDVLSLSATPIPRTLQQSLLGVRSISRIETPPITRRPIRTIVEYFSWQRSVEIIEEELLRGGQVYFLHNKIESIPHQVNKLRGFFPKEKIEYIHGKQESKTVEKNLLGFFGGKISVLVCSTIIESGLDVSNANCIIVTNPQNLGLSQLYQIRGRVGRGSRQASCYLFIPKKTTLSKKAYRRLKTIERHTSLGSGYSIASNDLDIRGAGAVFGYKQSGQITRVGLEYYNQLLKKAINTKTNKHQPEDVVDVLFFGKSLIPKHYVSSERDRLSFYTKTNTAKNKKSVLDVKNELIDRFGRLPVETSAFINLALIRLLYLNSLVRIVIINKDSIVFELLEKNLDDNIINKVLGYKNDVVFNKKFKESSSSLLVVFQAPENYDWFSLAKDCNSLFYP